MKSIKILMAITVLLSFTAVNAQIKNATTESVKIYGNCAMCKSTIEKAGNINKVAQVDWNNDTKMATLTYDPSKTNQDEILKRIALAGYDSDQFLAPDDAYSKLSGCCQYDRVKKLETAKTEIMEDHSMHNHNGTTDKPTEIKQEELVNATLTVYGNCGMCKKRIETAAMSVEGVKEATWDVETKILTVKFSDITFGKNGYSMDNVSKKIAEAGHDTQFYKASKDAYNALPGCCQYERPETKKEEHNHKH